MTVREILDKLYRQGDFEGEHQDIHPDRIEEAIAQLREVVGEMMDEVKTTMEGTSGYVLEGYIGQLEALSEVIKKLEE